MTQKLILFVLFEACKLKIIKRKEKQEKEEEEDDLDSDICSCRFVQSKECKVVTKVFQTVQKFHPCKIVYHRGCFDYCFDIHGITLEELYILYRYVVLGEA